MLEFEQILATANRVIFDMAGRYLSDVESAIVRGAIAARTYEEIAEATGYSLSYIKRDVGPKLWRLLSAGLGEKVSKTNFQQALKRYQTIQYSSIPILNRTDWGEAPDVSFFLGRTEELKTLTHWILQDSCRLVALLGMGGIGKTALGVKLAQQIQGEFKYVIWRSLRNAPFLETLLALMVPMVSEQKETRPELEHLLHYLRASKCLLILDNFEAILQPMELGKFRQGYEEYGKLLRLVGETAHQSCLIITSREKPNSIATREGIQLPVRSLSLSGLQEETDALLKAKGLSGSSQERKSLIDIYGGNPLAIKIAATSIEDLFEGNITTFLSQETIVFKGVRQLLEQQFARLSTLEETLMYWLAIAREWTGVEELLEDIMPPVSRNRLLEGLEALCGRNLIEKQGGQYTLQSVVMEYVCDRLIEKSVEELTTCKLDLFTRHALVKTTVKEYVRDSQVRLILNPIALELQKTFRVISALKQQVVRLLQTLRQIDHPLSNYGGGNLLNLCLHLRLDVSGFDFSDLSIWHACLQQVELQGLDFARADLTKSLFTETFANIVCVAFSTDGQILASGDTQGNIYLRQMPSGQTFKIYPAHQSWVHSITFSPDGKTLASASDDCSIKIWAIATGQRLHTFKHSHTVGRCAWNPNGTMLASVGFDQTLRVWNSQTGECLKVLRGNSPQIASVAWSPDGKFLACPGGDNTVLLWDASAGKLLDTLSALGEKVWSVAFSPDGQTLVSGSQDGTIQFWNVSTRECRQTIQGKLVAAWSLVFSSDGRTLAGSCQDNTVRIWETYTGQCLKTLQGHTSILWSLAFSPDGQTLASSSDDRTIKLWDTATGDCLKTWHGYSSAVWDVDASSNCQQLASAHQDGTIKLWDTATGDCLQTLRGHNSIVWSIALSRDGKFLASGSQDKTVRLWNTSTGECLNKLEKHLNLVQAVTWHPDGQLFASTSLDGTVKIWNTYTGECQQTLEHELIVAAAAWNQEGQILASGVQGGIIRLWDNNTGKCLKLLQSHTNTVVSIAWNPKKGQTLASGSQDNTVKLWDVEMGKCLNTFAEHTDWVWSVAWHPDGQILASASQDGTARLWDVKTGECLLVLRGHLSCLRSLSWSTDGQWLATGSIDGTIKLWNPQTGECLKTLRAKQPYEGTKVTGVTGITEAQQATLLRLGAISSE
ncbi:MAG: NACHT domain-containing protein [Prochloraceae cyanobacterium]|nr:NACHT domain-containing protein [Prochloraceae cyanobacterium]